MNLPVPTTDRDGRRWVDTLRRILARLDALEATSDVEVGTAFWWTAPGPVPLGYVEPLGQELSRRDYAGYYARIGITYGAGNELTTFTAPGPWPPLDATGRWIVRV